MVAVSSALKVVALLSAAGAVIVVVNAATWVAIKRGVMVKAAISAVIVGVVVAVDILIVPVE